MEAISQHDIGFPNVTIKMEEEEKPCGLDDSKMETFMRTSSGFPGAVIKQEEKDKLYNQGFEDRTSISGIPSGFLDIAIKPEEKEELCNQGCEERKIVAGNQSGFPKVVIKPEEKKQLLRKGSVETENVAWDQSGVSNLVKPEVEDRLYHQRCEGNGSAVDEQSEFSEMTVKEEDILDHGSEESESMTSDQAAKVTLDPYTAHPHLVLSQDFKSVNYGAKHQILPDNPERFSIRPCVLGREGFTGGRHYWVVTEGKEGVWAVGVARKSVMRKDFLKLCTEEKIWAIQKYTLGGGRSICWASSHSDNSVLPLSGNPRRILVSLNCDEGEVAFHDGDTGSHLYTYSGVSFSGETLIPFFHVSEGASLTISP